MAQRVLFWILFCSSFSVAATDTVLKLYRPYGDIINQAIPVVKKTLSGRCVLQSRLLVREDAWRCEAGGTVYDPCFVKAGENRTEALCPQSPWVGDSVSIKVVQSLHNEQNQSLDMSQAYPWAIELANGARCMAIDSLKQYEHMPVRFRCSEKHVLLGHIQRCKSVWTMLEKGPDGIETVELAKAWF